MNQASMTLAQLAEKVGARLQGDGTRVVSSCATLERAGPEQVSFLANQRYAGQVASSQAGAICIHEKQAAEHPDRNLLISNDPYYTFRNALVALVGFRTQPEPGVHPTAVVDPAAEVAADASIGAFCVVEAGAKIGARTVLYPSCYVGPEARVGADCLLYPQVSVYDRCVLGDRVTLHASCVIGQDGFGYATHKGVHHKIPQSGNAVVEDDVEMGAGCSVDRATMGSTVIGAGTKFSNAVTIGHGTRVGRGNLFVAQVGLAGSVTTGDYVVMGGQVGVAGHLKIGNMVRIAATSGVMKDVPDGVEIGGSPAIPMEDAKRTILAQMKLPDLLKEFRQLKKQVAALEKALAQRTNDQA